MIHGPVLPLTAILFQKMSQFNLQKLHLQFRKTDKFKKQINANQLNTCGGCSHDTTTQTRMHRASHRVSVGGRQTRTSANNSALVSLAVLHVASCCSTQDLSWSQALFKGLSLVLVSDWTGGDYSFPESCRTLRCFTATVC